MRYCRFELDEGSCYRLVETISDQEMITRAVDLPLERRLTPPKPELRSLQPVLLTEAKLLPPVTPSKIV